MSRSNNEESPEDEILLNICDMLPKFRRSGELSERLIRSFRVRIGRRAVNISMSPPSIRYSKKEKPNQPMEGYEWQDVEED